jgi:hypothetical protein
MKKLSTLALLALVGCVPASGASEPGSTSASGTELASNDPQSGEQEMVCKRERPTGSSVSRKVCVPKAKAGTRTAQDQQQMDRMQRNSNTITRH